MGNKTDSRAQWMWDAGWMGKTHLPGCCVAYRDRGNNCHIWLTRIKVQSRGCCRVQDGDILFELEGVEHFQTRRSRWERAKAAVDAAADHDAADLWPRTDKGNSW